MAPRGRTRPAASRYFCAHGGLPPSRSGHLRYPCGFGRSPAARSVIFKIFPFSVPPLGGIPDRVLRSITICMAKILPVLSFRSKTVRQPNRIASDLTDFGGKFHEMNGIPMIDGELI